jgi:hypothetical protein
VDIGRTKSGKALVAVVSELAGDAVAFVEQVTSYGGLVSPSGHDRCHEEQHPIKR